eukprot:11470360-Prorocentrum_lima.AAC.1
MTSSLVGSEMCIRDRTTMAKRWKLFEKMRTKYNILLKAVGNKGQTLFTSCLLYTSDAADDM